MSERVPRLPAPDSLPRLSIPANTLVDIREVGCRRTPQSSANSSSPTTLYDIDWQSPSRVRSGRLRTASGSVVHSSRSAAGGCISAAGGCVVAAGSCVSATGGCIAAAGGCITALGSYITAAGSCVSVTGGGISGRKTCEKSPSERSSGIYHTPEQPWRKSGRSREMCQALDPESPRPGCGFRRASTTSISSLSSFSSRRSSASTGGQKVALGRLGLRRPSHPRVRPHSTPPLIARRGGSHSGPSPFRPPLRTHSDGANPSMRKAHSTGKLSARRRLDSSTSHSSSRDLLTSYI